MSIYCKVIISNSNPGLLNNIWYVSDDGSDDNNCHSASAPCRNLQTVLDRATDGADIYVTSNTLSLDKVYRNISINVEVPAAYYKKSLLVPNCIVESKISFRLSSTLHKRVNITCLGKYLEPATA